MKKIISAGLAAMLAVSALSTAAYAEDTTIVATGVVAKPAIKVTLPKSMAFVFNPYELTVDAKGKVGAEITDGATTPATLNNKVIVPSYVFDETTKTTGWTITNNSGEGADLKMAVYAYAVNESSATFCVYDASSPDYTTASTGAKVSTTKRSLALTVKATAQKADATYDSAIDVFVHKAALTVATDKTIMDYASASPTLDGTDLASATSSPKIPATLVEKIPGAVQAAGSTTKSAGTAYISMSGEIANKGGLTWTEADIPTVTFIYSFDFAGGTTT